MPRSNMYRIVVQDHDDGQHCVWRVRYWDGTRRQFSEQVTERAEVPAALDRLKDAVISQEPARPVPVPSGT